MFTYFLSPTYLILVLQNLLEHVAVIFARPLRTWFQTDTEKKAATHWPPPKTCCTQTLGPIISHLHSLLGSPWFFSILSGSLQNLPEHEAEIWIFACPARTTSLTSRPRSSPKLEIVLTLP